MTILRTHVRSSLRYWPYFTFAAYAVFATVFLRERYEEFHRIHADSLRVYRPGELFFYWVPDDLNALKTSTLNFFFTLRVLFYYAAVTVFGIGLVEPVFRSKGIPLASWIGASFVVGYLATVAVGRLITIVAPHLIAPTAMFLTVALLGIWGVFQSGLLKEAIRGVGNTGVRRSWGWNVAVFSALVLFFAVFMIQFGRNFLTGDSTLFFGRYLNQVLPSIDPAGHFPLVDQQYDEVIFNYPLLYSSVGKDLVYLLFWLLSGVGKASIAAFAYGLLKLRGAKERGWLILAGLLWLFFGSPSPNPLKYIEVIVGHVPLIYSPHIGRWLGFVYPFFLVELFRGVDRRAKGRAPLYFYVLGALLGVGLAGTTFNNYFYCLAVFALYALYHENAFKGRSKTKVLAGPTFWVLALTLFLGPPLTYGLAQLPAVPYLNGVLLVLSGLAGVALMAGTLSWERLGAVFSKQHWYRYEWMSVMFAAGLLAFRVLGNVFSLSAIRHFVKHFPTLAAYAPSVFSEPFLVRGRVVVQPALRAFRYVGGVGECMHSQSFGDFVAYFGLRTLLGFGAFLTVHRAILKGRDIAEAGYLRFMILVFATAFSFSFFVQDFVSLSVDYFIKIRILEIPFYGIPLVGFMIFSRYLDGRDKRILTGFLLIWALVPFLVNYGVQQWATNFAFFIRQIVKVLG